MKTKTKFFIGVNIIAFITFIFLLGYNSDVKDYDFLYNLTVGGFLIQFYFLLKKLSD